MKTCTRCKESKDSNCFSPSKQHKDGLFPYCRACKSAYQKAYMAGKTLEERQAVGEEARRRRDVNELARSNYLLKQQQYAFQKRYGITTEQYMALADLQDKKCRICCRPPQRKKRGALHVDHDHGSGRVRGLLCDHCNRGLGFFYDDPDLLRKAAHYLEEALADQLQEQAEAIKALLD